jgi:hypothetical protein
VSPAVRPRHLGFLTFLLAVAPCDIVRGNRRGFLSPAAGNAGAPALIATENFVWKRREDNHVAGKLDGCCR